MIRVVIADDHDIVREGLRRILEAHGNIEVVGQAGGGQETLDICNQLDPDVVILDLDMPGGSGLEILPRILISTPGAKVLILTMHDDEETAARAIRAGAAGYMLKAASAAQLPEAVIKIASGGRSISPSVMERLALRNCGLGDENPLSQLSSQELQVLAGMAKGEQLKDTASRMNISVSATATYRKRIKDKLCINKNTDLMLFALKHGLGK